MEFYTWISHVHPLFL